MGLFAVPSSVKAIAPLVGQILVETETRRSRREVTELHLFYNRPTSGAVYAPVRQRLLPLDEDWRRRLARLPWPTKSLPEVMGGGTATLRALVREYLFVSLFRACAESLASENASRLAAMERADKNIDELLETLNGDIPSPAPEQHRRGAVRRGLGLRGVFEEKREYGHEMTSTPLGSLCSRVRWISQGGAPTDDRAPRRRPRRAGARLRPPVLQVTRPLLGGNAASSTGREGCVGK